MYECVKCKSKKEYLAPCFLINDLDYSERDKKVHIGMLSGAIQVCSDECAKQYIKQFTPIQENFDTGVFETFSYCCSHCCDEVDKDAPFYVLCYIDEKEDDVTLGIFCSVKCVNKSLVKVGLPKAKLE